jgi:transcriptional regulator GlxA family with amidase domain
MLRIACGAVIPDASGSYGPLDNLAHRLLLTTGIPVEGGASMVGFSSRSHFSRLFREHYGADPSSLRRSSKEAA